MKRLAILPAFLLLLAGTSSCDKNQVEPASSEITATDGSLNSLTQGKTVTSGVTGTYPFTYTDNTGIVRTEYRPLLNGSLNITAYEVVNGTIMAVGTLNGSTADFGAGTLPVRIPLSLSQISSSCSGLQINYGPMQFNLNGAVISTTTNPLLSVSPAQSNKNLLGNLLCSLGKILGNPSPSDTGGVVAHLNKIISVIGS
ncbi:hypothetical protein LJY25_11970 [Hymenobacter sp. BT175]|uniref:hypothetical protein n=1 Tax=Hymenobacter translucens TaxID=2886507 RepID=UPI001D0EA314|nr:hypothetical protein [Hymenobacter translucens]MCC2547166.1 hypothetical protein [Hymenobacter translucens]